MLLSDRDLRKEIENGRLALDPWDPAMLQPSSVDVRLDRYFRVFQNSRYTHIDPAQQQDELTSAVEPAGEEPFVLHPGEFVLGSTYESVALPDDLAGRLEGKALAIDTPIPTPSGWSSMGDLQVGDGVFGRDGAPRQVVAATEILLGRPCFDVLFSDGRTITADASHSWLTRAGSGCTPSLRTTAALASSLRVRHHVDPAAAVRCATATLPVDPYALGERLVDTDEAIPDSYLRADIDQRRALLQGLLAAAGEVDHCGHRTVVTRHGHRADAVVELASSLGLCPVAQKQPAIDRGVEQGVAYRVTVRPGQGWGILDVRPVPSRPVRCVQVSAPDGMFLVGPTFIPTHNSSLGRLGLLTHSTAGFIDPGFIGHITLELSNVANLPITLWPGMKIGQLCLFRLSSPAERPYGSAGVGSRYQGQRGPTPSRAYLNFHRVDTRR